MNRAELYREDPANRAFSKINMETRPGSHRPFVVVARLGRRKDALELQRKIQEFLETKV